MDRAEAIKILEDGDWWFALDAQYTIENPEDEKLHEAIDMAIAALREQEQREQGCEYCRGKEALYQHTNTTKLYINTFGQARTLLTECNPCPPYANCSVRGIPVRSAFIIKYCPECGRKLTEPPKEGAE